MNPKGSLHAQRTILGHLPGFELSHDFAPQPCDLAWTPADWAWLGGLANILLCSWFHGIPVLGFRFRRFDPEKALALMEKHRNNPTCYECHRKIDPLGLSMEHYDYIGAWRDRYTKKLPIDGSGEMPDGTAINGPAGIKQYPSARPDQCTRCLTEKLFIYAMGRRISFTDRDDIDRIVAIMPGHNHGLRSMP